MILRRIRRSPLGFNEARTDRPGGSDGTRITATSSARFNEARTDRPGG